ncbi:MAG: hypothetical protein IK118_02370 [Clostridia bacterium]|nr:hypothetical protein [Clostridia bacterium]MBR5427169.1 hypothetical protein [Clostridia bacterium]
MSLNKIITYLIYIIKTLESALLKIVNSISPTKFNSWEELINSQTTTEEGMTEAPVTEIEG